MDPLGRIAEQFKFDGAIRSIREFGSGNVNDTYLVSTTSLNNTGFILQRINQKVFPRPDLIMRNMLTVADHVQKKLEHEKSDSEKRWELPCPLSTIGDTDHFVDSQGNFWRAISFIEKTSSHETIQNIAHAGEVGYTLGKFQRLTNDLDPKKLHDTLPGFHVTPLYLRHFNEIWAAQSAHRYMSVEEKECLTFIKDRNDQVDILEKVKNEGRLPIRPVHGDPKVSNVLLDANTEIGVSIIDLDTVKPGLIQYDIGDCLRSCCNPIGEEINNPDEVYFDTAICRAVLSGYFSEANGFLLDADYAHIYDAVRLIAFELGLRFFTDHLEGNIYFKVKNEHHNLVRAVIQFKLTESIESQKKNILDIIKELKRTRVRSIISPMH